MFIIKSTSCDIVSCQSRLWFRKHVGFVKRRRNLMTRSRVNTINGSLCLCACKYWGLSLLQTANVGKEKLRDWTTTTVGPVVALDQVSHKKQEVSVKERLKEGRDASRSSTLFFVFLWRHIFEFSKHSEANLWCGSILIWTQIVLFANSLLIWGWCYNRGRTFLLSPPWLWLSARITRTK